MLKVMIYYFSAADSVFNKVQALTLPNPNFNFSSLFQ